MERFAQVYQNDYTEKKEPKQANADLLGQTNVDTEADESTSL